MLIMIIQDPLKADITMIMMHYLLMFKLPKTKLHYVASLRRMLMEAAPLLAHSSRPTEKVINVTDINIIIAIIAIIATIAIIAIIAASIINIINSRNSMTSIIKIVIC